MPFSTSRTAPPAAKSIKIEPQPVRIKVYCQQGVSLLSQYVLIESSVICL